MTSLTVLTLTVLVCLLWWFFVIRPYWGRCNDEEFVMVFITLIGGLVALCVIVAAVIEALGGGAWREPTRVCIVTALVSLPIGVAG